VPPGASPGTVFDGIRMDDCFDGFIQAEARQLDQTISDIIPWQPPPRHPGRR